MATLIHIVVAPVPSPTNINFSKLAHGNIAEPAQPIFSHQGVVCIC